MNKINWVNGQSGGTPLSAENLNLMQDNIEDAIDEKVVNEYSESTTDGYSCDYINNLKKWTLLGQGSSILLDDIEYDELLIVFEVFYTTGNYPMGASIIIPKEELSSITRYFETGSEVAIFRIGVSTTRIDKNICKLYKESYLNNVNIKVFYR